MTLDNVMVDLETLDVVESAVIVSIGAVRFGPEGLGDTFYRVLELKDQTRRGRTMNSDTVRWWMDQTAQAKTVFRVKADHVLEALTQFELFLHESGPEVRVWGNGATFDNVILAHAYRTYEIPLPWKFRNDRCYRTLKNMVPLGPGEGIEFAGTAHNALDDAIYQAEMAIIMMKKANLSWR